ncbi:amidohydrolase [Thalassospira xiamenensis]|nr:amidohydrolase [Thalassospira xiamenensis]
MNVKKKLCIQCACLAIFVSSKTLANDLMMSPNTGGAVTVLIEPVTVLSPELSEPLQNQQVFIKDGVIISIKAAGSELQLSDKDNLDKIDGTGLYLTPGLMDSHVHTGSLPGILADKTPGLVNAYYRQQPRSYLYFGVTQVVDLGSRAQEIAAFKQQPIRPDIWHCGAAPVLGGYGSTLNDKANLIHQHEQAVAASKTHSVASVINNIAKSGADCLKIYIEDGFGDASHLPLYSEKTFAEIRQSASALGLPVFAHANAYDMQQVALEQRVDVLAHGLWNWTGLPKLANSHQYVNPEAALLAHLQQIRQNKVGYQATLSVMDRLSAMFEPNLLSEDAIQHAIPPALLLWYAKEEAQWFKQELQADFAGMVDADVRARLSAVGMRGVYAAKTLSDLQHPLLLASDTPSAPAYSHQPGHGTYRELTLMAQAGISLKAIFEAATINNARLLNIAQQYGTVTEGKVANLLLLRENPLERIEAWNSIDTVILHGQPLPREMLSAKREK